MHKEMIGQTEFTFRMVDAPDLLQEIFRLRFQVYCRECNFIKEDDYPEGIEKDKFDTHSMQFVAEDQEGIIGTSRLIMDSELGFPLEEHCTKLNIKKDALPRQNLAEISRLVISKLYRRRKNDGMYYTPEYDDNVKNTDLINIAKRVRPMAFGMYREMYQESKRRGIKYWYAVMEKSLFVLLRMHGFIFEPIGEEVDYYGPVTPYLANIEEMEKSVHQKFPNLFKYFLDGLQPGYYPKFLQ